MGQTFQDLKQPELSRELSPREMAQTPECWMLWICALALQSGGLFMTVNLGSMVQVRIGPAVPATTAVTVFSCVQGLARLVSGSLSSGGNASVSAATGSATINGSLTSLGNANVSGAQDVTLSGSMLVGGNLGASAGRMLTVAIWPAASCALYEAVH